MRPNGQPGAPPPDVPRTTDDGPVPVAVAMWQAVQRVMRAFDTLMAEQGASWQVWHILLALHQGAPATQRELARAVGVREATMTHHLRAMEDRGLVVRTRDDANRRAQRIEVTEAGEAVYLRLKAAAVTFDRTLRDAIGEQPADAEAFLGTLHRLADAVPDDGRGAVPEGIPGNRRP
ncbi:MarR family winged helix-turn-helix transcriptional regulator [Promicromonospora thailandica]|uniref:MarR family transcriptional regulator, transcriptional regulator for hemolysin n=1 Tax=Promicromonospora thailandica TaxID=765201 RepID=A0A9X2G8X2_9MICO|nr:MarR family winged helix-turn-helix transcriptional regulator [Promicromonospora thailandica]MCP2264111.1 MarR family transcriptional regulator, transcriptional regulator for hemolysin [Promicromonospora thailandica]BFF21227.1 MarR family winged helix-turn-helix transcriptional regulator [Promicromonospora thailandica]